MEIRQAKANDVAAIARIHVASWQAAYTGLLPDQVIADHDIALRSKQWQRLYQRDAALVALVRGQVVGFITGGHQRSHLELGGGYPCEVYGLYVDPEDQRHGVGQALLLAKRRELGRPFTLDCLSSNRQAMGFYQSQGGSDVMLGDYVAGGQTFGVQVLGFDA